ncbi:hypothetical protein FOXB_13265 [Fusarium oxysporum f. sp. conglutinans Fo5176]|uniref:DUF6604 domain-containing protein n=1 Tax=Fusarium oxysporum (strain Fo5176) TaxID=660025 RepID=F9G3N3_FUSOF|nr:hypothetical protein FOXB_13265 [Fusarium oxysporum f. sp. conglutinans Fo5176]
MPSTSFLLIYQQYKRDTDIVASWLASTAKKHRYTTSLAAPPTAGTAANKSAAPSSGRLKGKARKEAKQQQKQHIAPSGIDKKDAPDPPPKPNMQANIAHIYFISVLKKVLQVYKPSKNFSDLPDVVLPARSLPINLKYIVENNKSETECIFAFITLLKDFIKLRQEVSNLWNEYCSGMINLPAAAVGANLAIKLARSMEEEMAPLLKNHGGVLALLPKYFGAAPRFYIILLACSKRFGRPRRIVHDKCLATPAQDKAALLEVVPDITLLFEIEGIPVLNEFAHGVKYMFETQEIPVWLCFAVQNYLDTLRSFGPNITRVLAEFYCFNEITTDLLDYTGIRYAAKPGAVLHAMQLYTAVRQQQQQQEEEEEEEHLVAVPEWPDLDRLIAIRGVSPANWLAAANRRKGKHGKVLLQRLRAGIRELKFRAPMSLCYAVQIEKHAIAEPTRRAWNAEAGAAADKKIKAKAKAAPAHLTLTAPQLVHYIAYAIQTEMPDLMFDYFAMHKMARGLLEKVQAQADDISLPLMPYITTDVADIAGLVFAVAAKEMASKSGQSRGVLGKVAMVIREYIIAELDINKCPT